MGKYKQHFLMIVMSITVGISGIPVISASSNNINMPTNENESEAVPQEESVPHGWLLENGDWYYYDEAGQKVTGWKLINSKYYYMYEDGRMASDTWVGDYYVNVDGTWTKTKQPAKWIKDSTGWWYRNEDGSYPVNCWKEIKGIWYFFNKQGYMKTGWLYNYGQWYWLADSGAMQTGWQYVNGKWYYLEADGHMLTGWKKLNGIWYYLNSLGKMVTGKNTINGLKYYFNQWGAMAELDVSDVITNALKPVGNTLYVWGGGWNEADNGSGETAVHIGVWSQWKEYFDNNKNNYSYRPGQIAWENGHREFRFWGLDCSGYLGWMTYNSVKNGKNSSGYVVEASKIAGSLADYGFGYTSTCTPNSTFYPGDIVSINGHCFLCLGQCQDGSVLILHSTPNGGVQMSGTVKGNGSSQASKLATQFMQQYYTDWWKYFGKEGKQSVSAERYLYGTKFSWKNAGAVYDSQNLKAKSADQILDYIRMIQ